MTEQGVPPPPLEPYEAALEGWIGGPDDWPNTITVSAAIGWAAELEPDPTTDDAATDYADLHGEQQLVQVDTNYKATRPGEHPVRLTRVAALELVKHMIEAAEDTFHYARVGRLRATQAAELLQTVDHVQHALQDLREHALQDLLHDTGIEA